MKFSVVIPAYNAEKTLAGCIDALLCQSVPQEQYEVIVIDDGSTDSTAEIAKKYPVIYHYQKNQGPAAARNRGANLAKGDIILFTDSDCVPDHFWIENMVAPLVKPTSCSSPESTYYRNSIVSGVKGAYRTKQSSMTARFAQAEFEDRFAMLEQVPFIDMVDTYSAAFRRDVFLDAGGFDPSFPVANNEDTELSYRLVSRGHLFVFVPEAFVYHTHPDTLKKYLRVKFWRGYWRIVVYARYPEKAVKDSYTPAVIKLQTLLMLLAFCLLPFSFFYKAIYLYIIPLMVAGVFLSSIPFSATIFKKDRAISCLSPFYCFLRACVFAAGSAGGILYVIFKYLLIRMRISK
ncbi:Similar to family 2 glycosyltransferase SpsQ [Desulfamplus magnetovallimortis]|uniref:Similar to family 2 glycosyltransferase SpsQ n=1 Tax=Desulfamplus magnetovallimortis TaxID=1246637 RepID=A0A1W1HDD5_9BACT|nr:glycosyltransferase [Desulfamplus magnetovallimortis]SLM30412.1 Similar to family 2 glycosyltransferase SpsQ [Desulfamplus magnetovallimortis]